MSKEKRRVPKLRFPGFTEDWEQREFSDIFAEVKSGLSRMLSNDDIGLPVVRANNINDGQLNLVDDIKYWYKNDPQGANTNNYLIEQGDILINFINSEAKMGTAAYVTRRPERDTIYTTNILRCKVNDEYNPYFIYSLTFLNSYKNYIASITKPAVNQASFTTVDFKKYSIKIPTVKEQNQIADLIETFNKLITLHQRKLDNLKLKKKALLQKLFPKNGERYPELRFPEFTDAWEQCKLDELTISIGDGLHGTPKYDENGSYYFINGNNLVDSKVSVTAETKKVAFEALSNDDRRLDSTSILMSINGTIGTLARYNNENIMLGKSVAYITPKNINRDFLFYQLQGNVIQSYFYKNLTGTTIKNLGLGTIKNAIVMSTLSEEESKIGQFFYKLDQFITLHQRKLDHLQLQKKALLQQMFV